MEDKKQYPSQYEKVKELTGQIENGIRELFDNPESSFRQWLKVCSTFHNYSLNNTILIAMQRPTATAVAGMTTWNKLGRKVIKGSKAIRILAPAPFKRKMEVDRVDPVTGNVIKNPDGTNAKETKEILQPAFKIVNCFDLAQTEGRPLPEVGVNELTGEVKDFDLFMEAIQRTSPVPIGFEQIDSGAKGYYHLVDKRIAIQEGMSQVQTLKTCLHELSHATLHAKTAQERDASDPVLSRNQKETEAEAVAACVSGFYNIDTSDYSFPYLASYASDRELPELKASLETIQKTANDLITRINENLEIIQKERGIEVKAPSEVEISGGKVSVLSELKEKAQAEKEKSPKKTTTRKKAKAKMEESL